MDKKEDIPQWAVSEARRTVENNDFAGTGEPLIDRVARALLKVREEAFEAAAKIAEDFEINNALLPFATDDTANQAAAVGQEFACDEIASAIRLHSQKGER